MKKNNAFNFVQRLKTETTYTKVSSEVVTMPSKALDPRTIMNRINSGTAVKQDMFVKLENDDNLTEDDLDKDTDDMIDLSLAKQKLDKFKDKVNKAKKKYDEEREKSENDVNNSDENLTSE